MSAKEIEEILNKVKNSIKKHKEEGYTDDMLVILEFDVIEWNLLLSYIEQLQKENKELQNIADEPIQIPNFLFDMTQELKIDELEKELQTTANKCKQLQNNRDKAIEYIEEKFFDGMYKYQLLNILKGDSDE